ncbi:MAG TPA: hypothetical protein VFL57_21895 [Bryobacteraceae bacterium]|nr:hypothetical protein [Bryobacteraceae bacterium]
MRFVVMFLLCAGVAATADTFLIKSLDGGRTWSDIDPGPPHQILDWFQADSQTGTLYALTQTGLADEWHLLVSSDGGQSWRERQTFAPTIYWIAAAGPDSAGTLYFVYELWGCPEKTVVIAEITDDGTRMEQYRAEGLAVIQDTTHIGFLTTIAADPVARGKLFSLVTKELCCDDDIFAYFQNLWVSVDRGRTWGRIDPPVTAGCSYPEMRIDPSDASLYVLCGNELFKSTDAGESWTRKPLPEGKRLWNLRTGPGAPAILYASRQGGIWKSIDGAATWQRLGNVPQESDERSLTPHPANAALIFISARSGIMRSEDGGGTWASVTESALLGESPFGIVIDPREPDTFYLTSRARQNLRLDQGHNSGQKPYR